LIWSAQSQPGRLLTLFIVLVCFEVFFLAVVVTLARPVLGDVEWWAILLGNAIAAAGMLAYFFVGHRGLGALALPRHRPRGGRAAPHAGPAGRRGARRAPRPVGGGGDVAAGAQVH